MGNCVCVCPKYFFYLRGTFSQAGRDFSCWRRARVCRRRKFIEKYCLQAQNSIFVQVHPEIEERSRERDGEEVADQHCWPGWKVKMSSLTDWFNDFSLGKKESGPPPKKRSFHLFIRKRGHQPFQPLFQLRLFVPYHSWQRFPHTAMHWGYSYKRK